MNAVTDARITVCRCIAAGALSGAFAGDPLVVAMPTMGSSR
jgi:hypothetical protein